MPQREVKRRCHSRALGSLVDLIKTQIWPESNTVQPISLRECASGFSLTLQVRTNCLELQARFIFCHTYWLGSWYRSQENYPSETFWTLNDPCLRCGSVAGSTSATGKQVKLKVTTLHLSYLKVRFLLCQEEIKFIMAKHGVEWNTVCGKSNKKEQGAGTCNQLVGPAFHVSCVMRKLPNMSVP